MSRKARVLFDFQKLPGIFIKKRKENDEKHNNNKIRVFFSKMKDSAFFNQ